MGAFTLLGDVEVNAVSNISYMKLTDKMNIRSIAAITASVAASVMFITVTYGVSDAIINAPKAIEKSVASQSETSVLRQSIDDIHV